MSATLKVDNITFQVGNIELRKPIELKKVKAKLRRVVVMRKDYPRLSITQSIEHRLSSEGFLIEDIINIESNSLEDWQNCDFVIVWVRAKTNL